MSKLKSTKCDILNNNICYAIGYCDICYLTQYIDANAYTSGVYGWNADVYFVDGVALVTGYRPFGKWVKSDVTREYNEKARKISENYSIAYDERKEAVNKLLLEFIEKIRA